jgi:hypothetical protein
VGFGIAIDDFGAEYAVLSDRSPSIRIPGDTLVRDLARGLIHQSPMTIEVIVSAREGPRNIVANIFEFAFFWTSGI